MTEGKGRCPHGEFSLFQGCPECIEAKADAEVNSEESIAKRIKEAEAKASPLHLGGSLAEAAKEAGAEVTEVKVTAITLRPGEDLEAHSHYEEALKLLLYAEARVITTPEDVKLVNDDMAFISKIKKAMEGKRKLLLDPLKSQADAIRETYDYLMLPVLGAQKIYKEKMLVYNAEQDRRRQEQEDINRKRMEAAQQEMALKGELSESVDLVKVTAEAPKTVRTDLGSITQTDHWVYEVLDFALLPDAYKVADSSQLNAIAKSHHDKKEVSGVRFFNKPFITSRAR